MAARRDAGGTGAHEAVVISPAQAMAWRMERQHLVRRAAPAEADLVVSRLCGLHAQLPTTALLTLWARVEGLDRDAVEEALWLKRRLVKLWAMRGTLHLLPAEELSLWLGALGTYRHYGMTEPNIVELADVVGRALEKSVLTRAELAAEAERLSGSKEQGERVRGSWGSYLKPASFRGQLCFAQSEGQLVRFTHPAAWLPGSGETLRGSQALEEVTRRFLGAFGPAEATDLARWWGVGPAQARRMLQSLGDEVCALQVDGALCWVLAEHLPHLASAEPVRSVRLLPAFDQWVVGASRTAAVQLAPRHRARVYRPQGWISPVLLVDGTMRGVWTSRRTSRTLQVEIAEFARLRARARGQAAEEAERLAEFLGLSLKLRWAK